MDTYGTSPTTRTQNRNVNQASQRRRARRKSNKLFDDKRIEQTGQVYDPNATYGRKKNQDYVDTKKGAFDVQANPEDYFQWLMGEAGGLRGPNPLYGGADPFGQYLQNETFDNLQTGYNAARIQSGGNIQFKDYMDSVGWGAGNVRGQLTAGNDTGNPFTSTSMPNAPGSVALQMPGFKDWLGEQDINRNRLGQNQLQRQRKRFNALPTTVQTPGMTSVQDAQRGFLSLTPKERGTYDPATAMKPGRFAIF
jgi:hypothetical protein